MLPLHQACIAAVILSDVPFMVLYSLSSYKCHCVPFLSMKLVLAALSKFIYCNTTVISVGTKTSENVNEIDTVPVKGVYQKNCLYRVKNAVSENRI